MYVNLVCMFNNTPTRGCYCQVPKLKTCIKYPAPTDLILALLIVNTIQNETLFSVVLYRCVVTVVLAEHCPR